MCIIIQEVYQLENICIKYIYYVEYNGNQVLKYNTKIKRLKGKSLDINTISFCL